MKPAMTYAEQRALIAAGWRLDGTMRAQRTIGDWHATIWTDGGYQLSRGTRHHWSQVDGGIIAAARAAEQAANMGE